MHYTASSRAPVAIATMLTPRERTRVEAAGEGSYQALHRDSVAELVEDIKANRASAVVGRRVRRAMRPARARRRRGTRARVSARADGRSADTARSLDAARNAIPMLSLGSTGVRQLVDVREADGWREARNYPGTAGGEAIQRQAISQLALDLSAVPQECGRFFEALFLAPPRVCTVRLLARRLDIVPTTMMSRFFRATEPAPKQYLATARLVRAARLFEKPGFSVSNVANHLDYSSPQSFGRHVRTIMHLTAAEFRDQDDGEGMLQHFRDTLVLPYLNQRRALRPLRPSWSAMYNAMYNKKR